MDPFDPPRNEESGHSKRRTSILKVPRKSIASIETVQPDKVVECAKPSDKRVSRRVSFAPANDVHLFAKDVKNASPTRSPLQELMPGGATQNGVQIKVIEDQQFAGMDAFLNTKIFQQKEKTNVSGSNFGEKTVMFNADDLDMTQCHTVTITKDKEFLNTSDVFLHGYGDKTMTFDRSMDMTLSHSLNMMCEQDVSFSSKPTPPSVFPFTSSLTPGTEFFSNASIDKENLVPKLNKSVTKKVGDPFVGLVGAEDDLGLTEADPLQCLFPQEIYEEPHKRKSQSGSKDNDFSYEPIESKRTVNFDTKDDGRSEKTIVFPDSGLMDITQNWTSNIVVAPSVSSSLDKCLKGRKSISTGLSVRPLEGQEKVQHQDAKLQRGSSYKGSETSLKTTMHQMIDSEENSKERTVRFSTDDACMDVTRCHTVKISSELQQQLNLDSGEKTVRFTTNKAEMDITQCLTVNIARDLVNGSPVLQTHESSVGSQAAQNVDLEFENLFASLSGQQTNVKTSQAKPFVTNQSHTPQNHPVNITGVLNPPLHQNVSLLPKYEEKTVRFNADDAIMDVTSSHTIHISTDLKPGLPFSERTVRFDEAMDTTQCHTVNIKDISPTLQESYLHPKSGERTAECSTRSNAKSETKSSTGLKGNSLQTCLDDSMHQSNGNTFPLPREKTLRFSVDDGNMDFTKSHTIMLNSDPHIIPALAILPQSEDKTVQFSSEDGGMEVTQCLTSNIGLEDEASRTDMSPTPANIIVDCPPPLKKREPAMYTNRRCRSLAGHGLNPALKARRSAPWGNQAVTSTLPTANGNINATQSQVNTEVDLNEKGTFETSKASVVNENIGFLSAIEEKSIVEISLKEECQENRDISMAEALPVQIQTQQVSEEHSQEVVETISTPSAEEVNFEEPVSKCEVEIKVQPNSPEINKKTDDEREVEDKSECSAASVEKDSDVPSQKSRRRSLADIQSKMKRISQMLSAPPENVAVDVNIVMPSLDPELKVEVHEVKPVPKDKPDTNVDECGNNPGDAQEESLSTTPFRLETKQLMSRLSVVGVKPKLPRRSKSDEAKTPHSSHAQAAGISTKIQNIQVQSQVCNFDLNVSDINDEELESYEDASDTLDPNGMDKESEIVTSFHEFDLDQELQDEVFVEQFPLVNERKRPLPEENITEDEKRIKTCNQTIILDPQTCTLESDHIPTSNTHTADSSNCSQTASLRCEATFESTSKQSLFESQLEDYASDIQRKFDDGTLTMAEFFKLFHIDFVIHNPRQSVVPGKVLSDTESTMLDLSHDRHISLPKQLVYEANVHSLTEQVEGFKVRMRDLDKPLVLFNRTLREEMEHFSEAEFKSFGVKLKERHSLYRKTSKAQSHDMKGLLYSDLIQANVEEQTKLRGSIEKADVMLKHLDECIAELEADLAAVEDDVKSHQEELSKVTDALATNEKSSSELDIQKKQSMNKMRRLKDETKNLERHLNMLHTLNEWKLIEIRTNCAIYTFLHETLHLVLVYEESEEIEEERKIVDISFKHLLDERSHCHARLVHTLVSQFTQEKSLTRKYSTSKHVPQLLQDISLVVSRCRHLGEELRRLKTWGSLRFDILDIHCLHSEVYIVFSSLKRFAKFETVFSVHLTNQLCALELKSFRNIIGNTTIQHIEEIVASSTSGQNHLTKIIKNIHSSLLS